MSKSTINTFDRYTTRKQHHADPFALEFLQDSFNMISANLGDHLELRMPCPFRCFASYFYNSILSYHNLFSLTDLKSI